MTIDIPSGSPRLPDDAMRLLVAIQASRGSPIEATTEAAFNALFDRMAILLTDPSQFDNPRYYLASLDPGKGKTEAACAFLKAWAAREFQPEGGVLIAVSRLDEVAAYIDRSGLTDDQFAVLVGPGEPIALRGRKDHQQAPVLFTTHEMIRRRSRGRSFRNQAAFHFQGSPRACRIWDESLLSALPATLRLDAIQALLEPLRPLSQDAARLVENLVQQVSATEPGESIKITYDFVWEGPQGRALPCREKERWDTLVNWAGEEVLVTNSNRNGLELVGTADRLPDDFAPAVILDASGRVRHTYKTWEQVGEHLVRLRTAPNDYAGLRVHHWDRACSRSTFDDLEDRAEVLQAAADLINGHGDKRWLVVHHLARGNLNVPQQLGGLISNPERVQFVHWGNHHGTNAFREINHVLVLGLWHMPTTVLQAYHLAAEGGREGPLALPEDVKDMARGEHQHHLLQAICRASVRNSVNGVCGDCTAYVIGRIAGANMKAVLAETFPGATVEDWRPLTAPLSGQAAAVAKVIEDRFSDPQVHSVRKADLRVEVGITSSRGLAQVLTRPDVAKWMADQGLGTTTREVVRKAA